MANSGRYPWNKETPWQKVRPIVAGILTMASTCLVFSAGWDEGQRTMAEKIVDEYYKGTDNQSDSEN